MGEANGAIGHEVIFESADESASMRAWDILETSRDGARVGAVLGGVRERREYISCKKK